MFADGVFGRPNANEAFLLRSWQFFCASVLLCLSTGSIADDVEHIEVLGIQRHNTIADVDLAHYNGFANIVTRTEFEDRFVDISELLNQSISAQTRQSAGTGSYSTAAIRGSSGKQVHTYLDGMLLTSPSSGYSQLAAIPVAIIEQLEIYPDFTPAEFGDANLGGAINIRTRLPRQGTGGRVAASIGSFGTEQQELAVWHGSQNTDAILAINHNRSDNDYPIDRELICDYMSCGSSDRRENAAYRQYSVLGKLRQQLGEQYALQLLLATSRSDNEVPIANNSKSHQASLDNRLQQFHLLLESGQVALDWGIRAYGHRQQEHFTDSGQLIVGGGSDIEQQLQTLGINIYQRWQAGRHRLGITADISASESDTDDKRTAEHFRARREKVALALADHWQLTRHTSINAIVRSLWMDDSTDNPLTGSSGPRCDGNDSDCTRNKNRYDSWQTGIAWQHGHWQLKANIGEMIRPPTLTERFGETGAFLGNAQLEAEKSRNLDAGLLYDSRYSSLSVAAFYKQLEDGIFIEYDARGVGHPRNISEAIISGIEAMLRQQLGAGFSLFAGGQWMDSENRSDIKANRDKKLYGFYHLSNQLGLDWHSASHTARLVYQYDDGLYFTPNNSVEAPPRKLLNAGYTWQPGAFTLNISINNLLDYRYLDFNFMPARGRSFTTTASYTF